MTDHIGPYELRGQLGRGAMAVVWRAWDPKLEREVAIKEPVLPSGADAATAADLSARFVREGKAAAALNHPGIVTIYAADVYDGRPAIVMELIEGETLADVLARGPLSPASSLAVLDQLLDAVGYAHARAVVHRDIKPDNIFVTLDGRVKLTDFGIAHVGTTAALTQAGTVMGTPGYMAPEQVTGQMVDSRADIFAIGVIGHELLTGRNPFGATDGVASTTIMYRIVHEAMPQLPAGASAGLPADIAGVLSIATAKDPASRFGDAQSFRSALHGGPIVAAAPATPAWAPSVMAPAATSAPSSTNWIPYLIVGAVGVVAIGLLFVFAGGAPSGRASGAVAPATAVTTAPAATPQQDRAAIIAVCDAYLAACAKDDLRAGYGLLSTTAQAAMSYDAFVAKAKPDGFDAVDHTPFIRNLVTYSDKTALSVDPQVIKFVSLDPTSATITYTNMYGPESFFDLDLSLKKEGSSWRIETSEMRTYAGA
jgi:serine/threonine-protein kinase